MTSKMNKVYISLIISIFILLLAGFMSGVKSSTNCCVTCPDFCKCERTAAEDACCTTAQCNTFVGFTCTGVGANCCFGDSCEIPTEASFF